MGIKETYKRIDDMETKAIEDYTTHYLKYEEGVYDALREVLGIIEEECPEVLEEQENGAE